MPYKTLDSVRRLHGTTGSDGHLMKPYLDSLTDRHTLDLIYEHDVLSRELLLRTLPDSNITEGEKQVLIDHTNYSNLYLYRLYNFGYTHPLDVD